ncbi:Cytochrome c oxidase subunit 4 [Dimargaris xerosporica]|nr:Cytochrome c oxidase subunit 4 [Dimargaris xerosporica]
MLVTALRRSMPVVARRSALVVRPQISRPFSALSVRFSASHDVDNPVVIQGPGAKEGAVPTNADQAAGLERAEYLANLEGRQLFDMDPLPADRVGTRDNPIVVDSVDPVRYVGCTGSPADSHETVWINVGKEHDYVRCPDCGSAYKMNYIGE